MISRPFWLNRIEQAWTEAPIAWLSGVRRSGKTTLVESLGTERVLYINCDLPSVEELVRDPQFFFRSCSKPVVVFDEIHQLCEPARLLKIGADMFPALKILATGSSTLAATRKFKDTLTGRKRMVHLPPVLYDELANFGVSLAQRLFHGGLPQAMLAEEKKPDFYREWLDSYFARDIQRLFGFRDMNRFNSLFEYVLKQSGGQLEVSRTATALGITRPTVESHLRALETTHAVTLLRPFHGGGRGEITRMAKIYAFDTGFVSFARGWDPLRSEDLGILWEHVVLEYLQAHLADTRPLYWRDKAGHEVDFILPTRRDEIDAIECKWDPASFDGASLKAFRALHPGGRNFLVCPGADPPYVKRSGDMEITVGTPSILGVGARLPLTD